LVAPLSLPQVDDEAVVSRLVEADILASVGESMLKVGLLGDAGCAIRMPGCGEAG